MSVPFGQHKTDEEKLADLKLQIQEDQLDVGMAKSEALSAEINAR
jgi:hypothetical protein